MSAWLQVYPDAWSLANGAAEAITTGLSAAVARAGNASIALSGGSTPGSVYEHLAKKDIAWDKVDVFWGDERCVPADSPASNFLMAQKTLLEKVRIPEKNIHRVMTELSPENAAREYELEMKRHFQSDAPAFDIVLLGLGDDGHTASLFPDTSALTVKQRLAINVFVPRLGSHRVTITLPAINAARKVMFLVSGEPKAAIVREIVERRPGTYPAELVRPSESPAWFLDAPAASLLSTKVTA